MYNAQIASNALQNAATVTTAGTTVGMTARMTTGGGVTATTTAGTHYRLPLFLTQWSHLSPTPTMPKKPTTGDSVPRSDGCDAIQDFVEGVHAEVQSDSSQASRSPTFGSRVIDYQLFAKGRYGECDPLGTRKHLDHAPELFVRVKYDTGEHKVLPSPLASVVRYVCPLRVKERWVRAVQNDAMSAGIIRHHGQDASYNLNPGKLDKKSNKFDNAERAERNRKYHPHSEATNHDWRRAWTSRGIVSPRAPDRAAEAPWLYAEGVDQ